MPRHHAALLVREHDLVEDEALRSASRSAIGEPCGDRECLRLALCLWSVLSCNTSMPTQHNRHSTPAIMPSTTYIKCASASSNHELLRALSAFVCTTSVLST